MAVFYHEMSVVSGFTTRRVAIDGSHGPVAVARLVADHLGHFSDQKSGRRVKLHGINFASNAKLPKTPHQPTYMKPNDCGLYREGDHVSFVGRPFPLSEAYEHITRIKQCGFNAIRFVFTWEAIEHEGPGVYDLEYANYVVEVLKVIDEVGGLYVFMDPHQDVWSRFTGGSGAPLWTLYAAGLDPQHFKNTLAARIHYDSTKPESFTKMVWATNYYRLASELMFTMFFSGKLFFPKCVINGVNVQDFLQSHFIDAVGFLIGHIKSEIPEIFGTSFLGVESMNEPNTGMYAYSNLNECPEDLELKLDEIPTPIQSLRLGMGIAQNIELFHLTIFGPKKKGNVIWEPNGKRAWIADDSMDKHYGFLRAPEWKLGECVFAQHGVWDPSTGELLRPDYFKVNPNTGEMLTQRTFNNGPFLEFWDAFKTRMRSIDENMFLIMQPPVFTVPPVVKDTHHIDNRTIIALHYYDGMSLMFKTWNKYMNVDTLGIVRGRYLNPVFSIVLGELNIRKLIAKQLKEMREETRECVGKSVPVIFTETGMPFDMDNKKAFKNGDFKSQEAANDALLSALTTHNLDFTYWNYNPDNNHRWGDDWNLEDFSIWSQDDLEELHCMDGSNYHEWLSKNSTTSFPSTRKAPATGTSEGAQSIASTESYYTPHGKREEHREAGFDVESNSSLTINMLSGVRCPKAIIRPYVSLCNGLVRHFEFDIHTGDLQIEIVCDKHATQNPDSGSEHSRLVNNWDTPEEEEVYPTVIMIPELHFPEDTFQIEVSTGDVVVKKDGINQWIEWRYIPQPHSTVTIEVKPLRCKTDSGSIRSSLKALACGYL